MTVHFMNKQYHISLQICIIKFHEYAQVYEIAISSITTMFSCTCGMYFLQVLMTKVVKISSTRVDQIEDIHMSYV